MIEEGTIIQGTLRDEDLIPAFTAELQKVRPEIARIFLRDNALDYERIANGRPLIVTDRDIYMIPMLLEDLWKALDNYAPAGMYFGVHPNDGSDFGYWRTELRSK